MSAERSSGRFPFFGRFRARRMHRRFLIIPLLIAVGAGLVGFGFGPHGRCGGDPARMERHMKAFVDDRLDDIDANDTQRKTIQAIAQDLFAELKSLHGEREDTREQFLSFFEAEKPDAAAVHAAIDARIERLRAAAHKAADAGLKVHDALTPAQRAEIAEGVREHGCRH